MRSGRRSSTSQGAKHGVMSVGMPIKGSGKGGRGRVDNVSAMSSGGLELLTLNLDKMSKKKTKLQEPINRHYL